MSQQKATKKWLNIIIIVISALVLAFMLIGKLMERKIPSVNRGGGESHLSVDRAQGVPQLIKIEYNATTLSFHSDGEWISRDEPSAKQASNLSPERVEEIHSLWLQVLSQKSMPFDKETASYLAAQSFEVKLYFLSKDRPLLARVEYLQGDQKLLTRVVFPELKQQILLKSFYYQRLAVGDN